MDELNLGRVVGDQGPQGIPGVEGAPGDDGFSPTISPNPNNTADVYKLDITTKDGKMTTPNLKGANGAWTGDPVVMGIKGDKEDIYRTGNVNITAENIGAATTEQVDAAIRSAILDSWEARY